MDLSSKSLIFGVGWDENEINYYLNGTKTKNVDLTTEFNDNNPCKPDVKDKPIFSKNIRIGTGPNSLGDRESSEYAKSTLPQTLNIDYVTV